MTTIGTQSIGEILKTLVTRLGYFKSLTLLASLGLAFRLALVFIPQTVLGVNSYGFGWDISTFADWMLTIKSAGLRAYVADPSINYPPLFADLLAAIGGIGQALFPNDPGEATRVALNFLKLPALLSDVGIALVVARVARRWYSERAALWGAGLYLFLPVTWYDSAVWGQVDSIAAFFMIISVSFAIEHKPELSISALSLAVLTKPQGVLAALVVLPFLIGSSIRRELPWRRIAAGLAAGLVTFAVIATPWDLRSYNTGPLRDFPVVGDMTGLWEQAKSTAGLFQVLTANAFNPWQWVGTGPLNRQYQFGIAAWSTDDFAVMGMPAYQLGLALFALVALVVFVAIAYRPSPKVVLLGYGVLLVAFFDLPTRVHERYLVQAFAVLAVIWAHYWRDRLLLAAVATANVINLHAILSGGLNVIFPSSPAESPSVVYQHHGEAPEYYGILTPQFSAGFTRAEFVVNGVIAVHLLALAYLLYQFVLQLRKER